MHVFCTNLLPSKTIAIELIHQLCELIEFQLKISSQFSLKKVSRSRPRGEQFLVRWAVPQLHDIDALARMVDPSLKGAYPMKSLSRFADIISSCVQVRAISAHLVYRGVSGFLKVLYELFAVLSVLSPGLRIFHNCLCIGETDFFFFLFLDKKNAIPYRCTS